MLVFPKILLAAILASDPSASPAQQGDAPAARPVTCTFSNPSYSGHCRQRASATTGQTANDACQEILACLNNVQCSKTYCNATQIRGGWRLVAAKEDSGDE